MSPTKNYGVVRGVSTDSAEITVAMPRGGEFRCKNNGFEIGQPVCFLLDTLGARVIKIWPKEIAALQEYLGSCPELQEAIAADELAEPLEEDDMVELLTQEIEEDHDGDVDDSSEGRGDEAGFDQSLFEFGGTFEEWANIDWPGHCPDP